MKYQRLPVQLDEVERVKAFRDSFQIRDEQNFKLGVADVAGGNEEQFVGAAAQQERIDEIGVFSDYGIALALIKLVEDSVGGAIAEGQV